jgi:hypothetical protein
MRELEAVLENVRLAAACGADAPMTLTVALASAGVLDRAAATAMLVDHAAEIDLAVAVAAAQARAPAPLEPELLFEPELARIRPDVGDHEIRGRLLFRDLLGKRSFFQVAAWAIAGLELSQSDAELLEQLGINTQLADPHIWPLAVTRRIAARGGGLAHALVGGIASLCTQNLAVQPVGGFMRFLDRIEQSLQIETLEDALAKVLARRERIPGFGRPVLGPDERVPQVEALADEYGRSAGASFRLAHAINTVLFQKKGLRINSAGLQGAIMRDLGFSAGAAVSFCVLYFVVPVLAHVVYAEEHTSARPQGEVGH